MDSPEFFDLSRVYVRFTWWDIGYVLVFFLTHLNYPNNICLMSIIQILKWLKQKCKESFGDAVKNFFTRLIFLIVSILGVALLLVRKSLDHTFEVSVMQILIILAVFFIIVVVVHCAIYRLRQQVTLSGYCRDVIYDVVWEWDSVPLDTFGDIRPTPICPSCAYEVCHSQHPKYSNKVMMTCESCYWTTDLQGDWDSIKFDIIKVIEQRIRNNDWKTAQKRLKALKK